MDALHSWYCIVLQQKNFFNSAKEFRKSFAKKVAQVRFLHRSVRQKNFSLKIIFIIGRSSSVFSLIMSSMRKQILEIVKEANNKKITT